MSNFKLAYERKTGWYGYRHINGTFHLKRFQDRGDVKEALSSTFVSQMYGPWYGCTRGEAAERFRRATLKGVN